MNLRHILVALLAAVVSTTALADDYPSKSIRLVVPWPAGGSSDATARLVGQHLEKRLKQTVVIDNRPGASGNIGAQNVAKSAPDGYTLLLSSGPFSVNPSLFSKLPFDTARDFAPVALLVTSPSVLVVNKDYPPSTLEAFMAMAKDPAKPVVFASPANGTAQHLGMELLRAKAGLELVHVPYKGSAPALIDLMGGQINVMMSGIVDISKHVKAGNMKALAITGAKRSSVLPDVPTLIEKGLAETGTGGWVGIHVPAGTSPEIIKRLNSDINAVLAEESIKNTFATLGSEVQQTTPQEFSAFFDQQLNLWAQAVKISGAKVD